MIQRPCSRVQRLFTFCEVPTTVSELFHVCDPFFFTQIRSSGCCLVAYVIISEKPTMESFLGKHSQYKKSCWSKAYHVKTNLLENFVSEFHYVTH